MDAGKFWRFWNFRVKLGVKMDVVGWFGFPIAKVRAVKDAQFAIIGAKRETLTGEADGPGAGFQQEGRRPRGGDAQGSSGPMLYLRGIMPSMLRVRPARK